MTVTRGMPVGIIRIWIPWLVLTLLLAVVWTFWPSPAPEVGVSAPLPPATEVRTVEKVVERVKYVKVYPSETKQNLDLPKDVVADPVKKVTATGKLSADERPYTMTAVLDTSSGESEVYARPDPLPWVAVSTKSQVGLFYGYKGHEPVLRLHGVQEVLQVKALRAGATAALDSDGETFVGLGVWARW